MIMATLTQGFTLGYLINSTPDALVNERVLQALATHRTGWMSGLWLLATGATIEYCDLPDRWLKILFRLMVYHAWHQAVLNNLYTYLGVIGGKTRMAFTGDMQYDIAVLLSVTFPMLVYTSCVIWLIGIYRRSRKAKSE